jgi:hypothetical protein
MTVKRTKTAFTRLLIWSGKTELLKWITNRVLGRRACIQCILQHGACFLRTGEGAK